jgi:hypothetical protein
MKTCVYLLKSYNVKKLFISVCIIMFYVINPVNAKLWDRGGGLLYDDVLNITWLQDASFIKTAGLDHDGRMHIFEALEFADKFIYHDSVRNVDIKNWRLPRVRPVNGIKFNGKLSLDGSSDEGYNITSPQSELAYMFHVNLGLKGYYSLTGKEQSDFGIPGNGNISLVKNLMNGVYWTSTPAEPYTDRNYWMFDTKFGYQNFYNKNDMLFVWLVHDGDVVNVK